MIARACRIWDKTSMRMLYPKDMQRMGVFLTGAGEPVQLKGGMTLAKLQNVVVMYDTGINTDSGQPIWESDIIDATVPTEYGSLIKVRGYMQWNKMEGKWFLYIPKSPAIVHGSGFPVIGHQVSGNIYEQPDLLAPEVSRET